MRPDLDLPGAALLGWCASSRAHKLHAFHVAVAIATFSSQHCALHEMH